LRITVIATETTTLFEQRKKEIEFVAAALLKGRL
jgi:hypothetical protein